MNKEKKSPVPKPRHKPPKSPKKPRGKLDLEETRNLILPNIEDLHHRMIELQKKEESLFGQVKFYPGPLPGHKPPILKLQSIESILAKLISLTSDLKVAEEALLDKVKSPRQPLRHKPPKI